MNNDTASSGPASRANATASIPSTVVPSASGRGAEAPTQGLPLSGTALDELAERAAAAATIVGVGESTRFSRETFGVRDQLLRRLVRDHGFRALAVQDSAGAGADLDAYVSGGPGSAADALGRAWRPQRTAEMAAALEWIRAFNQAHPHDPVRIFGVKPAQAGREDYDTVLEHVRARAPELLAQAASHLDPIRAAHDLDEHVQRAQGTHPGRPFAEHARDALALVGSLPEGDGREAALDRMRLIVDFHEHSVAGRGDYAGEATVWSDVIDGFHRRTGLRVVYWDGIAHTSAAGTVLGMAPEQDARATVGSVLRARYGDRYVSVAIGFHHGDLGVTVVPEPVAGSLDARLGEVDAAAHWLDLRRAEVRRHWDGPARARVISGVYDPHDDAAGYLAVDSLPEAFDVLVHIRRASAVRWLS
ncbi:erythromycin esterase family protein [Streptomyces sp. NPDC006530]|uniref:erythromycin esterase family protein n=1 Tax=Streptomyces sp. NPDC006530 TaxID=3364750 RepID=UPI0036B24059